MRCEIAHYEQGNHVGKGGYSSCIEVRKFRGRSQEYLGEEAVLKVLDGRDEVKPIPSIVPAHLSSSTTK
jgi:hypothetical protein